MIKESAQRFFLTKGSVNPNHILFLEEDLFMASEFKVRPEAFPPEMDERMTFTRVAMLAGGVVHYLSVVGSPEQITEKL